MSGNRRIIQTRYLDIPYQEITKCLIERACHIPAAKLKSRWAAARGAPIVIDTTPGPQPQPYNARCAGPFWMIANSDCCVCPHIAEIGD